MDLFLHRGLFWTAAVDSKQSMFVSSYPVVITWRHLKCSTAVFVCAGVWRLQHWFCLHRAIAFFFFFQPWGLYIEGKKKSLFIEWSCVQRPVLRIRLLLMNTLVKSSHLIEVVSSRDEMWSFLFWFDVRATWLPNNKDSADTQCMPQTALRCKLFSPSRCSRLKCDFLHFGNLYKTKKLWV